MPTARTRLARRIIPLVLGVSLVGAAIAGATALVPHTNLIIALLRSPIAP